MDHLLESTMAEISKLCSTFFTCVRVTYDACAKSQRAKMTYVPFTNISLNRPESGSLTSLAITTSLTMQLVDFDINSVVEYSLIDFLLH